ncbi:MAG: glycosyltransferase family 9 protein [Acidobacteriota bacterium]
MSADPETPTSLLIVRLGAVGDVVRTLPLVKAIRRRHPSMTIGWVVEELSAGLLEGLDFIDRIHVLRRRSLAASLRRPWRWPDALSTWLELRTELRKARYELILDVHGTFKASRVARLARGGDTRLVGLGPGGSKETAHWVYDEVVPYPAEPVLTRIQRAFLLGRAAGLLPDDEEIAVEHGLRFAPERVQRAHEFLEPLGRPRVLLFPFASATKKGLRKRWPLARWVELARSLSDELTVVLAWGSPREGEEARAALGEPGRVQLTPRTDLLELTEVLRGVDLVVTGDTGPMHLAAGVDTRVLALFGPSDPVINRPWGDAHEVIVHEPLGELEVERVRRSVLAKLSD